MHPLFHRLLKLIKILVNLFQDDAPEECSPLVGLWFRLGKS